MESPITPINDQIAFEFLEDTSQGKFNERSAGGILLVQQTHKQVDYCRWGRVMAIGPDVEAIAVNDVVLIKNLQWTNEFRIDEHKCWLTNEGQILATWEDENSLPSEVT